MIDDEISKSINYKKDGDKLNEIKRLQSYTLYSIQYLRNQMSIKYLKDQRAKRHLNDREVINV